MHAQACLEHPLQMSQEGLHVLLALPTHSAGEPALQQCLPQNPGQRLLFVGSLGDFVPFHEPRNPAPTPHTHTPRVLPMGPSVEAVAYRAAPALLATKPDAHPQTFSLSQALGFQAANPVFLPDPSLPLPPPRSPPPWSS
jgi:hypothetical protein